MCLFSFGICGPCLVAGERALFSRFFRMLLLCSKHAGIQNAQQRLWQLVIGCVILLITFVNTYSNSCVCSHCSVVQPNTCAGDYSHLTAIIMQQHLFSSCRNHCHFVYGVQELEGLQRQLFVSIGTYIIGASLGTNLDWIL